MEIHIWIEIQPQINTTRIDVSANMIGTLVSTRSEASVFLGGGFSACLLDKTCLTLVRMRGLISFLFRKYKYSYNHKTIQAQGHPTNYEISSSENAAWGKTIKVYPGEAYLRFLRILGQSNSMIARREFWTLSWAVTLCCTDSIWNGAKMREGGFSFSYNAALPPLAIWAPTVDAEYLAVASSTLSNQLCSDCIFSMA